MVKAICEHCQRRFTVEIQHRFLDGDIQEIFYTCPKCKAHFHVAKTTEVIRSLNRQIQVIKKRCVLSPNDGALYKNLQILRARHKELMDGLNGKS